MRFLGEIIRRVTARSAPPSEVREDGRARGWWAPWFREERRQNREEKKKERTGRQAGKRKYRDGKGREEEIFALSRACHAVPREKNLSSFLFLSFFLSSKSGYILRCWIWIMYERKRKTLWRLYTARVRHHAEIHESIIRFLIRRCRIWRMRFGIFLGTLFVPFDEGNLLSCEEVSSGIKYEESRVHLYNS